MTTALYRRYRPETFAEVVGQDHVTGPLRQALRSGQINHAYLFSGPRGCGKTTSARILARCLNCAEGPTDTPCGVCPSCVELARGGPGSLDVVEIDAASHGGVDDARDLRERATFAPARDRFKVFILDEAHMVSPQGFNALLKIVEEPPEHVKFIFATTEPDKVIGTIRSRTHHYPFRLVPPETMTDYLGQICGTEGITVGSGVLPLVVRAGGGSVRDSLSVLDQLIAGSGPDGLVYEDAVALLGYTHASLLDDLVEAIAARDGASAFRVVERVISTGHEPRRFVEDLLERLRDLIVLQASGEAADAVLRDIPGDQLARMRTQAQHLGASELSRSADLANAALTEMSGATSPRLHLELLMARLLLPAMDDSAVGLGARVDRLERTGVPAGPAATGQAPAVNPVTPVERVAVVTGPVPTAETTASGAALARAAMAAAGRGGGATGPDGAASDAASAPERPVRDEPRPEVAPDGSAPAPQGTAPDQADDTSGLDAADARPSRPDSAPARPDSGPAGTDSGPAPSDSGPVGTDSGPAPSGSGPARTDSGPARGDSAPVPPQQPEPQPEATASVPAGGAPADPGLATARTGAGQDTEMLRRRWPEVLETLAGLKKTTWVLISQNAQVIELDATTLTLGFTAPGLATAFRGGQHAELVHQAVRETLGFDVRVEGVLAGDGPAPRAAAPVATVRPGAPAASGSTTPAGSTAPDAAAREHDSAPAAAPDTAADDDEAPADPWTQATPAEPVAPRDGAGRRTADTQDGADRRIDRAQDGGNQRTDRAADATSAPDRGAERSAESRVPAGHGPDRAPGAQDAAGGSDWPEVAPIPGSSGSDGSSAAPTGGPSTSGPADAASGPVEWPEVAVIPGSSSDSAADGSAHAATGAPGVVTDGSAARSDAADRSTPAGSSGPSPAQNGSGPGAAGASSGSAGSPGAESTAAGPSSAGQVSPGTAWDAGQSAPTGTDSSPGDGPWTTAGPGSAGDPDAEHRAASSPGAQSSADAPSPGAATSPAASPRPSAADEPPLGDEPPPPWDDPEDPGAPEPPEDPWAAPRSAATRPDPAARGGSAAGAGSANGAAGQRGSATGAAPAGAPATRGSAAGPGASAAPAVPLTGAARVRAAMARDSGGQASRPTPATPDWADDEPSMDDPDISASGMVGIPLVVQALGGVIIEEQVDDAP